MCLLSLSPAWRIYAQEQSQQTQPPAPTTPAPKTAEKPRLPDTSDGTFSLSLFYWLTSARPALRTGKASTTEQPSDLDFPGKSKQAPGLILSFPAGDHHTLRFSYFRAKGDGNTIVSKDLAIFATGYNTGDYLSAGYTLQNAKISLDYLSWPFPIGQRRFWVKTLWEVQYTSFTSHFVAPLRPTQDEAGNFIDNTSKGSNWFIYPSLGMGFEYLASQHFRWEVKASGFALPHRSTIWDAETFAAYRHGQIEFLVGAKGFHFKTNPKQEAYVKGTLSGGFVGFRWYPKL